MRGCSVKPVRDQAGNQGIPGDGFKVNDWEEDANAECLCKAVGGREGRSLRPPPISNPSCPIKATTVCTHLLLISSQVKCL